MPPLPVIANTTRCTLIWEGANGITPRNVIHFYTPVITEEEFSALLANSFTNDMFACMSTAQLMGTVEILPLDGHSPTATVTLVSTIHGEGTGEQSPASAGVLSLRTSQRGPRGRGRVFIGPATEDLIQNGILEGDPISTMDNGWSTFQATMGGSGAFLTVASYKHADQNLVLSANMDTVLGTQRRRQNQLR